MTADVVTRFNRSMRQLDGVFLAIALILIALILFIPSQASESVRFTLVSLWKSHPLPVAVYCYRCLRPSQRRR